MACVTISACRAYEGNEDCATYDYSDCNTTEPVSGLLNIRLTVDDQHPSVPVMVIRGKYEDGELVWQDTLNVSKYTLNVDFNYYYTVAALYINGGDTIRVIDGDQVKSDATNICDSTCWSVTDGNTDVRLK